jgi:tetratricopeptide (TPR) repeat protein/uncharacterized caspase-like protein
VSKEHHGAGFYNGMPRLFSEKYMPQKNNTCRLILAAIGAAFLLTSICLAQGENPTSTTWAVVIGISKYPKLPANQQLLYADKDAADFAAAMRKLSGGNVRLLVNQEATAEAIKEAIGNWLARSASENDTVTIYFSGHGIAESEYGEAYLLAYDSDAGQPYSSGVSLRELSYAISRRVKANRILIIADAVRRGFFDEEIVGDAPSKIFTTAFNQLSQWRGGIATLLANSVGEYSREGQKWDSHGVFTKHLLDAINSGIDVNADRTSDAEEIYNTVLARVSKDTSKKQRPSKSGTTLAQFKLAGKDTEPAISDSRGVEAQPMAGLANSSPIQPTSNISKPTELAAVPKPLESTPTQINQSTPPAVSPKPAQMNAETTGVTTSASQPATGSPVATAKPNQPIASAPKPEIIKPTTPAVHTKIAKTDQPIPNRVEAAKTTQPKVVPNTSTATKSVQPVVPKSEPRPANSTGVSIAESSATPGSVKSKPLPPTVAAVPATPTNPPGEKVMVAIPANISTPAPSPLVLELEAAISVGRLIEPRGNCAWDTYQQMDQQPELAAEAARLKSRLVDALFHTGNVILSGDVRSDNIADKVDEFKRAGQLLARARSLAPEKTEITALEKLSAAAALISLQFFDEAEKALLQLPKMAATENALGIVYAGKLDNWRAERAFKNASELSQTSASPHYNLGLLYRSQKNEAALAEFEKAAQLDAKNYAAFLAVGDEYFSRNRWQPAAEAYRKAVALRPYDDNLHTKLGHALYSQGLRDEANKAYQKAKELRSKQ